MRNFNTSGRFAQIAALLVLVAGITAATALA